MPDDLKKHLEQLNRNIEKRLAVVKEWEWTAKKAVQDEYWFIGHTAKRMAERYGLKLTIEAYKRISRAMEMAPTICPMKKSAVLKELDVNGQRVFVVICITTNRVKTVLTQKMANHYINQHNRKMAEFGSVFKSKIA